MLSQLDLDFKSICLSIYLSIYLDVCVFICISQSIYVNGLSRQFI